MGDKRFGISLLSKSSFSKAYLEEVLIDKATGEVLVKTPEGDVISYNYNSRLNAHINATKNDANNIGVYGNIFSIEFDNIIAPCIMEFNKEYVVAPIDISGNCRKLLLHTDIDVVNVNKTGISYIPNNVIIEYKLVVNYSDGTKSDPISVSKSIHTLNTHVVEITDINEDKIVSSIQLESFMIKDTVLDYNDTPITNNNTIRPIFNSIFIVIGV